MDLLFFSISSHSNQGWEDAQWVECWLGKRGELSSASQNSGKQPETGASSGPLTGVRAKMATTSSRETLSKDKSISEQKKQWRAIK